MSQINENNLPSNFCLYTGDICCDNVIPISRKRNWITEVRLPYHVKLEDYLKSTINKNENNSVLFDGCNPNTVLFLRSFGFKSIPVGKEAILELNKDHFLKNP